MIEIKCTQAQYDRLIDCAQAYFKNGKCFLGKGFISCPAIKKPEQKIECEECLRKHIKRILSVPKLKIKLDKMSNL